MQFCPRCARSRIPRDGLCPECGETCQVGGFCSVCERPWPRPVGSLCPKHDVPLIEDPGRASDRPAQDPGRWVALATYGHPSAAEAPRLRLEAEGIPTFLEGERIAQLAAFQVATGGVKLLVPEHLSHEARIVLDQTWAPLPVTTATQAHGEDEFDELTPDPGSRRRAAMRWFIWIVLIGPMALSLLSWILRNR